MISPKSFAYMFRLLDSAVQLASIGNQSFEDSCFYVVRRHENECPGCTTVMTRDYLDFMVEHLSSSSNLVPQRYILLKATLI